MNKKEKLKEYIKGHRYFSLKQVYKDLSLNRKITKDYLFQFKEENLIFDAGYGIYSTIEKRFELLQKNRVDTILNLLKKRFPYTEFVIWNTQQLQPLYRHTQQHHITFIEVEKEAVPSFFEKVSDEYRETQIEKRNKGYFDSFEISRNPVVIRNLPSRSPKRDHFPELEKIMVDMFIDLEGYRYISEDDYWKIWEELFENYRIKIGTLKNYSKRRKCFESLFSQLPEIKELI